MVYRLVIKCTPPQRLEVQDMITGEFKLSEYCMSGWEQDCETLQDLDKAIQDLASCDSIVQVSNLP